MKCERGGLGGGTGSPQTGSHRDRGSPAQLNPTPTPPATGLARARHICCLSVRFCFHFWTAQGCAQESLLAA